MSCRRPSPPWARPPQHPWRLEEIKLGHTISARSLNDVVQNRDSQDGCCVTFGRIDDDPSLVDVVTAHESCSRLHARIAFDRGGTPWLRDLGSGNGTFVNERRLPREACGKEDAATCNSNRRGSRGVVLYPGDAIRFGASTRLYILEGPVEFERGAAKLRGKANEGATAASAKAASGNADEPPPKANEEGCSWGMSDDIIPAEEDPKLQVRDHSDLPPLPSMDSFFFSSKYKISDALHKLRGRYNTKTHKLQSIQTESGRIMQKENMGVALTEGQRGQLAKNQERMASLEKEVANLKESIEDGMHTAIHGKARAKKRPKEERRYVDDDDVDDFYDRTASKRQRKENTVESEQSLIRKWKSMLEAHAKQRWAASRASERCAALQIEMDKSNDDDEDAFYLRNDLSLANDNLSKATKSLEEMEKELDEVEYLLKVVNPKLTWDREDGLIGTDIVKKGGEAGGSAPAWPLTQRENDVDAVESDSIMMPPPPAINLSVEMPPPPPVAAPPTSKPTSPEQPRILGPTVPPACSIDGRSAQKSSHNNLGELTKPPKKKKPIGPARPSANIQGTLAALRHAGTDYGSEPSAPRTGNGNDGVSQKKTATDPFDPRQDEWQAPVGQDGSGRTALHDKFKGRY